MYIDSVIKSLPKAIEDKLFENHKHTINRIIKLKALINNADENTLSINQLLVYGEQLMELEAQAQREIEIYADYMKLRPFINFRIGDIN